MQNYEEYRDAVGITQTVMVQVLRPYFPGFTKSIAAISNNPRKYGVCLCPEAEVVLTETFGPGPGLAFPPEQNDVSMPVPRRREHRRKGNRITVWFSDDMYFRLLSLKTAKEYPTIQAMAEAAVAEFIDRYSEA